MFSSNWNSRRPTSGWATCWATRSPPALGDRTRALDSYSKAMAQVDHVLRANPRDRKARQFAATIRLQTGGALTFAGKGDEGIAQVQRSVEELKALLPESPNDVALRLALAKAFEFHATQVSQRGGLIAATAAAEDEDRESLAQLNQALAIDPQDARIFRQFADTESAMGNLLGSVKPLEAIEHYRSAIGYLDRLPAEVNDSIEIRRVRAGINLNLGWSLGQIDRYPEALDAIGKGQTILAAEAAAHPENTSASYHLTAVYRSRGIVCGYAKMTDCAIDSFEKAAAIHERLLKKDASNVTYRALRGELLMRISSLLVKRGEAASARTRAAEGLQILTSLASEPRASATQANEACRWLVETEVKDLRDFKRAVALCEKAVTLTHEKDSFSLERLASARASLEDRTGAVEAAQKALALLPALEPGKPKSRQQVSLEQAIAGWRK
jgi:tetratricopeptide (TPR) repeat protein